MKQREKIIVIAGVVLVLLVGAWKLARPRAGVSEAGSIKGAIARIQECDRRRRAVEGLVRDLAISVPQATVAEQESHIRADLARKAQECKLIVMNQKGLKSTSRGTTVQLIQYRLEVFGLYNDFMKLINSLEKSPIPYVIREVQFDNSPKAPTEGQQGEGQPPDQAPPPEQDQGHRGRSGPAKVIPPNGRVHVTMRVQSYLFPPEPTINRVQVAAGAPAGRPAPTPGQTAAASAPPAPAQEKKPAQAEGKNKKETKPEVKPEKKTKENPEGKPEKKLEAKP